MSKPVALVLGAGANVGLSVAKKFLESGYSVAVTSRKTEDGDTPEGYYNVKVDLGHPELIPSVFEKVKAKLGVPSVIVYNAYSMTEADTVLSIPYDKLNYDLNVNTTTPYLCAQLALQAWTSSSSSSPTGNKTFIYTGNKQNVLLFPKYPAMTALGIGKAGTAHWIGLAAENFGEKGMRFYFGDQRQKDGSPMYTALSGEAHAEFYYELAQREGQGPYLATFVEGVGYVDFNKSDHGL